MYQTYQLDLDECSVWYIATPLVSTNALPFKINEAGKFYAGKDYYTLRHSKDDYLLIYTISGEGTLKYANKELSLTIGKAAFIDCRELHQYFTSKKSKTKWIFYWMHLGGESCNFFYSKLFIDGFSIFTMQQEEKVTDSFDNILSSINQVGSMAYFNLSNDASQLLTQLVNSKFHKAVGGVLDDAMISVMQYIKKNSEYPLTLEQMASEVGLSKYYFIKAFKTYAQVTPYKYMLMCRVNKAKKLLRTTESTISVIANLVGFTEECGFNRTFKSMTGLTPMQYRRWYTGE